MESAEPDPAYSTHQKFLEHYVKKTDGDVLELGTGFGSTGMLCELLKNTGRKLVSVDNNKEWLNKMKQLYKPNKSHEYIYTSNWCGTIMELTERKWSVVFIDQNPWEARAIALFAFKDTADYVIVHDVDYFPKNGVFGDYISEFMFDFSKEFKNWRVYYPPLPFPYYTGPPTLVGSNLDKEITESILELEGDNQMGVEQNAVVQDNKYKSKISKMLKLKISKMRKELKF